MLIGMCKYKWGLNLKMNCLEVGVMGREQNIQVKVHKEKDKQSVGNKILTNVIKFGFLNIKM